MKWGKNKQTMFVVSKEPKEVNVNRDKLFDLFLHASHSFSLRVLKLVSGAAKVTQHIMTLVMQEDILHL